MRLSKLTLCTFAGVIVGCSTNPVSNNGTNNVTNPPFLVSKLHDVNREVVPVSDSRVTTQATSINQFATKMYLKIIEEGENTFFSPYSITSALGMTNAGAVGATDSEIRKALQVTLPGEDFHYALNGLNQSLESHSDATENLEIKVENSIWAQKEIVKLKVGFLDKLARHYNAGVNMLDFITYPDSSRVIINDWIADQTNQRILNLLPQNSIASNTRLVLTNAIYFLADWHTRFDAAKTDDQQFTRLNGSKVTVPMMMLRDTTLKLLYSQKGNARMLELPYKGKRIVMDFILPDTGAFTSFESSLTSEKINALIDGLDSTTLPPVRIPRFEFTSQTISLKKAFIDMGMVQPFTGSANFSDMSNLSLMIDDILHKAFIKVDEKGTEAAAATAVIMIKISFPPPPIPSFVANRPFIYLIRDTQTKTILFMGRVLDPTVKE